MELKISKWGNSMGIRIPKNILEETGLGENSLVQVKQDKNNIIIFSVKRKPKLKNLLQAINDENLHHEFVYNPVGKEIW